MREVNNLHGISIIACTNKLGYLDNIFTNFDQQLLPEKELIIILNNDGLHADEWVKKAKEYDNVQVYQLSQETTLGSCLNFGIDQAKFSYVAKWDDDDYYGPAYLSEGLKTFETTDADIIGKRALFMYFEDTKELRLRWPRGEYKTGRIVLGGTIIAKRSVLKQVPFADISIGEDVALQRNARAQGFRVQSTSRYHYVYFRRNVSEHTWKDAGRYLKRTSKHIGFVNDFKKLVDKNI